MATLDDRLLGEKLQYYCSSSEDEDGEEEEEEGKENDSSPTVKEASLLPQHPEIRGWEGASTNTGPKGVLKDWQRFKQLESEKRIEQERERILLAKKLALSCRSHLDDEKDKEEQQKDNEDVDGLIDEEFLRQYISKRMEEMMVTTSNKAQFGRLITLENGETFLDAVDKEEAGVTVIVHIHDQEAMGCDAMNGCLACLAQEYPHVKFCKLPASAAGVSSHFKVTGLPALLIYKAGQMMGNFVRLTDEFGDDFYATDVESFLIEHGMLRDKSLIPPGIKGPAIPNDDDDDDSDFSLDD
ncbi:phosducin-like protein [Homarus americanus]|uniref:Phosducin-like protein-like n=1 Tax=Homarus americanus TaxID=6706 RepID=A0A8J5MW86_HOMAM|nr:phosducin-like protein [Homarus americanus]XP_042226015.1 phosducin-like protein [Homarus americanus]KAG7166775.1 Phosducin-like protein-like [Homarus americanus]